MATKAELTTGSASAATEHTEEPQLKELVTQEAGLSTEIELKVIRNDLGILLPSDGMGEAEGMVCAPVAAPRPQLQERFMWTKNTEHCYRT